VGDRPGRAPVGLAHPGLPGHLPFQEQLGAGQYPRLQTSPVEDTGVIVMPYGPDDFHGFRFFVQVTDLIAKP
jgi:hypothetical protein